MTRSRFGVERIGSVEVFYDQALGWTLRAFSSSSRGGADGTRLTFALDEPSLGTATLLTVPAVLADENYATIGEWQIDEEQATFWINVAPQGIPGPPPSYQSNEAIFDAEIRWERRGIGRATPTS